MGLMEDKDPNNILDDMFDLFKKLPHPDREPKRFLFYMKMFKHIIERRQKENDHGT
jgi:hypothetical protein